MSANTAWCTPLAKKPCMRRTRAWSLPTGRSAHSQLRNLRVCPFLACSICTHAGFPGEDRVKWRLHAPAWLADRATAGRWDPAADSERDGWQ